MSNYLEEALFIYPRRYRKYREWIGARDARRLLLRELLRRREVLDVRVGGVPIGIRSLSSDLRVAAHALHEEEFAPLEIGSPNVILDAGANIGATSLYFARRFPNATVYAIEPEPETYSLLEKNCKQCKNIVPVCAALCGQDGIVKLSGSEGLEWGYSITKSKGTKQSEVRGVSLLSLMEEYGILRIDFMKLDIEGAEKEVMAGAAAWLHRVRAISAELHDGACLGASREFYLATARWEHLAKFGEKIFIQP